MSTETLEQPKTELIKVEEAGALIISGLKDALPFSQKMHALALNAFKPVLDTIEAEGMNAELDKQLNDLIVRANSAIEKMEAKRKPGTQMMTKIAKIFTSLENEVEAQKVIAQGYRNGWAKTCAEKEKTETARILKEQNAAKEKISIKAEVEKQIREGYQNKLYAFKQGAQNKFNALTLDNISEVTEALKTLKMHYPHDKFLELPVNVMSLYIDKAELAPVIYDTRESLYNELSANFRENMEDIQQTLLNLIPSRVNELKEIAKSSKAEQQRLNEEALKRQQQESERLANEATQAKINDQAKINLNQQIEQTGNLFDTQAQLAEVKEQSGPVREGYKITVMSMAGWGAIFLFWFEKEGQGQNAAAIGKKTLDQMKSFCEKHAHKNDEKIDHIHVVYEEDYKAVTVK